MKIPLWMLQPEAARFHLSEPIELSSGALRALVDLLTLHSSTKVKSEKHQEPTHAASHLGIRARRARPPAYARILEDLAPDEGRILRLLAVEGPQPAVDVRGGLLPFTATSELVAPGLNMLGPESGCRHLDDVPAYLTNLNRLGLIWFSREPIDDLSRYQVLEAQPDALEATKKAKRARTVRRSIRLTPFGDDFCSTVLPMDTSEFDALTEDAAESEMLLKAARMGVPVVASRTSPTEMAVRLAEQLNVTVCGYVRPDSLNLYAGQAVVTAPSSAVRTA